MKDKKIVIQRSFTGKADFQTRANSYSHSSSYSLTSYILTRIHHQSHTITMLIHSHWYVYPSQIYTQDHVHIHIHCHLQAYSYSYVHLDSRLKLIIIHSHSHSNSQIFINVHDCIHSYFHSHSPTNSSSHWYSYICSYSN